MYLTYSEYQSFGGKLKEKEFNRAEFAARMRIDNLTFNRLQSEEPMREIVKRLVMELVEQKLWGTTDGREITSSSNDGRSVSFASNQGKATQLIRDYLSNETDSQGIPLLYAGNV